MEVYTLERFDAPSIFEMSLMSAPPHDEASILGGHRTVQILFFPSYSRGIQVRTHEFFGYES